MPLGECDPTGCCEAVEVVDGHGVARAVPGLRRLSRRRSRPGGRRRANGARGDGDGCDCQTGDASLDDAEPMHRKRFLLPK